MKTRFKKDGSVNFTLTPVEISTLLDVLDGYSHFVSAIFPTVAPLDSHFFLRIKQMRSEFDSALENSFDDLPF